MKLSEEFVSGIGSGTDNWKVKLDQPTRIVSIEPIAPPAEGKKSRFKVMVAGREKPVMFTASRFLDAMSQLPSVYNPHEHSFNEEQLSKVEIVTENDQAGWVTKVIPVPVAATSLAKK